MTLYDLLLGPFVDFAFMRRALVACMALALGSAPIGVFLVLRRMSLIGDTMAHSILPGAAVGFLFAGLSLPWMGVGGFVAGLMVAVASGLLSRHTQMKEDASFASLFLISLAGGVLIVSVKGSAADLMHVLFGSILAVDDAALLVMAAIASVSLAVLALIYRPLVGECFDPTFLKVAGGRGALVHMAFLVLVVLNMVAGFQALGTLMAVGLMMLPATAARFWAEEIGPLIGLAIVLAILSGYAGLVLSYAADLPAGPAIVLTAGGLHLFSVAFGRQGGLVGRLLWRR